MKKFASLLIAGLLCFGAFSLSACNPQSETEDGETGEEIVKMPQVPEGVNLGDVDLADALDTEAKLFERRNNSNSVIQDEYTYVKEICFNETNGEENGVYEADVLINLKYLNKDGKIYGENNQFRTFNDNRDENNEAGYKHKEKNECMTFINNGSIGTLLRRDYYMKNSNGETSDTLPLYLAGYTANGADVLNNKYAGIRLLAYSSNENIRELNILPYSAEFLSVDTEYRLTNCQDYTKLFRFIDAETVDRYSTQSDVKVKNYKSTFKADGTKMYYECAYKIEFTDFNSDKIYYSCEYKYATYLDTDAELNESDFKDNYITDEVLKDIYYYDCDEKQVAADFAEGKEIIINPVGGANVSELNYNYKENTTAYLAPYMLFIDGDKRAQGRLAGNVDVSYAKVENGKVIINSNGALDSAIQDAGKLIDLGIYESVDFNNAKIYLVVRSDLKDTEKGLISMGELYIPLN